MSLIGTRIIRDLVFTGLYLITINARVALSKDVAAHPDMASTAKKPLTFR